MRKTVSGFTLVELLIVIVVIAILATISVVAYNGIQNRSYDTAVKNDLSRNARNAELFKVDNSKYPNGYSNLTGMKTVGYGMVASQGAYHTGSNNHVFCYEADGAEFAIIARSKSGKVWYVSNSQTSPVEYPQAWDPSIAYLCPEVIGNNTTGQWLYQAGVWSTAIL
jgi:prepilin-type N-terminal cleavage/methylation domain-containing protein